MIGNIKRNVLNTLLQNFLEQSYKPILITEGSQKVNQEIATVFMKWLLLTILLVQLTIKKFLGQFSNQKIHRLHHL